ncbi:MAG: retroviral-like aspartic protease family protein [Candidatus Latescibacteria bacterium]|nr:retroviral-like aspartic protease family protein [Candidatus Latescibacterota bacterium]
MGRIVEKIKVANLFDERDTQQGKIKAKDVRGLEVEVLIDTGATFLCLKKNLIEALGLVPLGQKTVKTSNGRVTRTIYSTVTVYLKDRFAQVNVTELPEDCPNLLGQILLQIMDFVVDMRDEKVIGNPEHGGEWMWEEY